MVLSFEKNIVLLRVFAFDIFVFKFLIIHILYQYHYFNRFFEALFSLNTLVGRGLEELKE